MRNRVSILAKKGPIKCFVYFVFFSTIATKILGHSLVISSLANARSFIYKSGDPLFVNANTTDIWRICPHNLNPAKCYPNYVKSNDCTIITPDCRCYNWQVEETSGILAIDNCVYVQIPQPLDVVNFSLHWTMHYTYPVLPPGYLSYQKILYRELLSQTLSFNDYSTITAPLFCEAAKRQVFMPEFDLCEYAFYLNISYIPGAVFSYNPPATIGRAVLAVLTTLAIISYTLVYLRHPKKVKLV